MEEFISTTFIILGNFLCGYVWYQIGYSKGYSDGVDKMFRMFDEAIEEAVKDDARREEA